MSRRVPNETQFVEFFCMSNSVGYYRIEGNKVLKYGGYVFSETGIAVNEVCEHNDFIRVSDKYDKEYESDIGTD